MSEDAKVLNFVYQNSQMGVATIKQLLPMIKEEAFKKQLESQLQEYSQMNEESKRLLNRHGYNEKGINALERIMAYLMIDGKTLKDKSSSHIAKMLIEGSNMGILDALKQIHQFEHEVEKDVIDLMKKLLKMEEDNVERLKAVI